MCARRVAAALLAGLLTVVAACTNRRHEPAVSIGEPARVQDSTRPVGRGPQPRPLGGVSLREVLGESLSTPTSPTAAAIEDQFLALTNGARAAASVAPVTRDPDLEAYAHAHVRSIADDGRLYHSNIKSLLGPWWMIGENVGVGPDAPSIQAAYERSPSHYDNIVGSNFRYVGVGVVVNGGRVYTVEVYGI